MLYYMNVETHEHYVGWLLIDVVAHTTEEKETNTKMGLIEYWDTKVLKSKCLPLDSGLKRKNRFQAVYLVLLVICDHDHVEDSAIDSFVDNLKLNKKLLENHVPATVMLFNPTSEMVIPRFRWAWRSRSLLQTCCAIRSQVMLAGWWRCTHRARWCWPRTWWTSMMKVNWMNKVSATIMMLKNLL